ncbi:MAG: hypothetical protein R3F14_05090 [Polyangiaceae bacterium]
MPMPLSPPMIATCARRRVAAARMSPSLRSSSTRPMKRPYTCDGGRALTTSRPPSGIARPEAGISSVVNAWRTMRAASCDTHTA